MNKGGSFMKHKNPKSLIVFIIALLTILIAVFIIYELIVSADNEKKLSQQQIIQEAKAHFQGMVDTRSWNAQYGGVYVKSKNGLTPNPYLKDNTLLAKNGEVLIKINPAWMTRQVSEISNKQGTYHYKITSLKPLNPSNKADKFEKQALEFFQDHKDEKYFYNFNNNEKSFNFMGSLKVKQSCMKCHEQQGYKIGDIRGGIRVSIPMALHNERINILEEKTKSSINIVIFVALILIIIFYWFINMLFKRQYEIEHANEILEKKVSERTHDLEVVVSHEQHLKDVLKIITEVNEMLITSYSTKTILKNATAKLATNDAYTLVLSGLIHDDILDIVSKSVNEKNILPKNVISLKEDVGNEIYDVIRKSYMMKHSIIEKVSCESQKDSNRRREDDLEFSWVIALPLLQGIDDEVYGIIAVFCSRQEGFEVEEMKILENMAHDISIALYSHKQRDSILAMEKEKIANYEETILAFVNIIEQRDTYTAGHTIRVAEYCEKIASKMGYSQEDIHRLEKAAILHDIGKVATPDAILLKPGKLSRLEYELIKQHSEVGADMLERISIYKDLAEIIRFHHSRYDGKGYPRTASPDEIPMLSHIMIVADAFDAMTTNRIYRPRKSIDEALEEIAHGSETQFHPEVVKASLIALKDIEISITSQMPTSELEQRRMSYFFQDSLTGLYNEDYLLTVLNTPSHKYKCLHIIDLKKFTKYNKTNGWESGNLFLKSFANFLNRAFPKSLLIRYHGDDFIILNQIHHDIEIEIFQQCEVIEESLVKVGITHYDIDEYFDFEKFKEIQNQ